MATPNFRKNEYHLKRKALGPLVIYLRNDDILLMYLCLLFFPQS